MTDIVERLLNWLNQSQQEQHETAIEAAVEIKRLREELDTWQSVFPDVAPEHVQPDRSLLEKEIERLRKALKLAKEWGVDSDMGGKNPVSAALRHWIKGGMRGPLTTEQAGDEG